MLKAFESLFSAVAEPDTPDAPENAAELAAAALMMEIARADRSLDASEEAAMRGAIESAFDLPAADVENLLDEARTQSEDATSLYEFTRVINDRFDDAAKYTLMVNLWRVAHADGNVDRYESHLLRRIADLIHMRHREYISAKLEGGAENREN